MAEFGFFGSGVPASFDFFGSGVPARVLCLEKGADRWTDVPAFVLAHLQHTVARGKHLFRTPLVDGRCNVFDFARMFRYDGPYHGPGAHAAAELAWYDESGRAFFPPGKAHLQVQPSEAFTVVDEREAVDIVHMWTLDTAVVTGAERCVPGDAALGIYRDKDRDLGGVKLGWYGASPGDVIMAGKTLFRSRNWNLIGRPRAHGLGLHLAPLRFPYLSMGMAEADYTGEACVLLCRIIHGLPEAIRAGSDQRINTRQDVRSSGAVDYLRNPSWYVVWAEHMNECIVPLCLVTFRKRPAVPLGPAINCTPVFLDINKLRREIKRFLPSSQLQDLDRYFDTDTRNHHNFCKCVSDLIGLDMFVGAVLKTLEAWRNPEER